tara:strand:- start:102 stop:1145 length:1044 start_codon:yes stop_codon:yes gene_type:complete
MKKIKNVDDWRTLKFNQIIDVRSPDEFLEDHIPEAINLPVLNNSERSKVGKIYKQESRIKAKILGASIISKNISRFLLNDLKNIPTHWEYLIYCWRGGQRSRSLALILNEIGYNVSVLSGGYKNYRSKIIQDLKKVSDYKFFVIQGKTGTGKTKIIQELIKRNAQAIDLENLAQHRGSLLGKELNVVQPSQKLFESSLHKNLESFTTSSPIFIESESSKIGKLHLPKNFWHHIKNSKRISLEVPINERTRFLIKDYKHLINNSSLIEPFLKNIRSKVQNELFSFLLKKVEKKQWKEFVETVLINYYDPKYEFSHAQNINNVIYSYKLNNFSKKNILELVEKIIQKTN